MNKKITDPILVQNIQTSTFIEQTTGPIKDFFESVIGGSISVVVPFCAIMLTGSWKCYFIILGMCFIATMFGTIKFIYQLYKILKYLVTLVF